MSETTGPGWDYFAAKIDEWLNANKKVAIEVRWGSFPLGMVATWIRRAEQAEAALAAANKKAALADEIRLAWDQWRPTGAIMDLAYWAERYDALESGETQC